MFKDMDINKLAKDITGCVVLGVVAIVSIMNGQQDLAGVCIGALAAWIIKNGVTK